MTYRSIFTITSVALLFNASGCSALVGDLGDHAQEQAGAPGLAGAGAGGTGTGEAGAGGRDSDGGRTAQGGTDAVGGVSTKQTGLPSFTSDKVYVVPARTTLTLWHGSVIEPGTIFKFGEGAKLELSDYVPVTVSGDDETGGRIIFTSLKDDSVGGDTNGDGADSQPDEFDWVGVTITGDGATVRNVECRYANWGITVSGTNLTVQNSTFVHNFRALAIYEGALGHFETRVNDNLFYANGSPLDISGNVPVDASNVFHDPKDPSVKNSEQYIRVSYEVNTNVTWSNTEVPFVLGGMRQDLRIQPGGWLHLESGVILKFMDGSRLEIEDGGSLNYAETTRFTSFGDDSILGDTNGDGIHLAGRWEGIYDKATERWIGGSNITYADYPLP